MVMYSKDADGIANSADHDQTAVHTVCPDLSIQIQGASSFKTYQYEGQHNFKMLYLQMTLWKSWLDTKFSSFLVGIEHRTFSTRGKCANYDSIIWINFLLWIFYCQLAQELTHSSTSITSSISSLDILPAGSSWFRNLPIAALVMTINLLTGHFTSCCQLVQELTHSSTNNHFINPLSGYSTSCCQLVQKLPHSSTSITLSISCLDILP